MNAHKSIRKQLLRLHGHGIVVLVEILEQGPLSGWSEVRVVEMKLVGHNGGPRDKRRQIPVHDAGWGSKRGNDKKSVKGSNK